MKDVSIIIITGHRQELLKRLLLQVTDQFSESEVIVVVNNDHQSYSELIKQFPVVWLKGNFKTPGLARNAGIKTASRSWLLFLDDDTELSSDFRKKGETTLSTLKDDIVVLGGPDQSPPQSSYFSKALNFALTSPMATAHTRLRHTNKIKEVKRGDESNLILCNLWVRKGFLEKHNISFNSELFRNEENLFITQIINSGGLVEYHPELFIYHLRKTRVDKLFKAVFSSGKHRVKSSLFSARLFSPLFLVPALWVIYLAFLPILRDVPYGLTPLKIYLTLSIFMSFKVGSGLYWPGVLAYQIILNLGYGLGVLYGLVCLPLWRLRIRS